MAAHSYTVTDAGLHRRPSDGSLMSMPVISYPNTKPYQSDMVIDPKLTDDSLDDQSPAEWEANNPSRCPPRQSFHTTPRMYGNGGIPNAGQHAPGFYAAYDSSFSQQSSPGHSNNGSHIGSPSIQSETFVSLGPATPQDTRMLAQPLYEAEDPDYRYLTPPEPQQGAGAAVGWMGGALGSPLMEDHPLGSDELCRMAMEFPTFAVDPIYELNHGTCSDKNGFDAFDAGNAGTNRPMLLSCAEPTIDADQGFQRIPNTHKGDRGRNSLHKRTSSLAPRGQDLNPMRSLSGAGSFFPAGGKRRKYSPCAASPPSPTSDRRYCQNCKVNFQTAKQLEDHVKAKHARPFICVFHFAGCPARFEAKNEWKRHVSTKHVSLKYWLCLEGNCAQSRGSPTHRRTGMLPTLGSIFNRKDLYTSHVRRMHPEAAREDEREGRRQAQGPEGGDRLKRMQEGALRKRLDFLPDRMACPVLGCSSEFHGSNAWNERMEHVAQKHFDYTSPEYQADVGFGGPNDAGLTAWASRSDVQIIKRTSSGGWCLCEPLKGENDCKRRHHEMSDREPEMDGFLLRR
ncbi:hypothetical protein ESCO_006162 [Escovopsis weberi]|uniref:C2H2-type domain-containing protein n=1 Tax=Escovopsis weberi TaxID=150374 RepID=A0A0M8MVG1_ESCWE|nr:hypothetical protein ESCO_006162 [Escovopsis weberi]